MKPFSFALFIVVWFISTSCQVKNGTTSNGLISNHVPVTNSFTVTVPSSRTYAEGSVLNFTLTHPFSLIVSGSPRLALTIGASTVYADYVSGSGSKSLTFSYTVANGDTDTDGISVSSSLDLNGGTIQFDLTDVSTTLSIPSTTGIKIDTTGPTVAGAVAPPAGKYYSGYMLMFEVSFSEPVTVTGTPSINLTFDECTVAGAQTRQAKYASGSGTGTLRFTYSVENDCNETAGGMPLTTSIQLNGGTIKDLAGHGAPLDFSAFLSSPIANTTQVRGRYPLISGIVSPAAGTYAPGGNLDFTLNFDRAVTVSGTTPYFNIKIGTDATKQATYLSG
ncbi:MAG: hypothetical protein ACJ76H_14225, partial [Bacteriovoracaceae bacterium]